MADTVEEVYNQTIGNTAFSGGPVTALTSDANTRYVIRDIDIERPQSMVNAGIFNMTAQINDVQIVNLTNGSAGGTSIMGPSSNLKLASTLYPIPDSSYLATRIFHNIPGNLTNSPISWTSTSQYSAFDVSYGSVSESGREVNAVSPTIGGSNTFYYVDDKIFWDQVDGNSTMQFYRRVPGTSTNDTISTDSYSWVSYDNGTNFYWQHSSSSFKKYDATTHTTTTIAMTGPGAGKATSSYSRSYFCNGFLFAGSSSGEVRVINVSNGVTHWISSSGISWASDIKFAVGYEVSEDKFYYVTFFNTTTNTRRSRVIDQPLSTWNPAGENLTVSSVFADENIGNGTAPRYVGYNYSARVYMLGKKVYWRSTDSPYTDILSADIDKTWLDAANISKVYSSLVHGTSGGENFYYQPGSATNAEITSEFPSFDTKVRITAVKSV
jgi:hypothetical protein